MLEWSAERTRRMSRAEKMRTHFNLTGACKQWKYCRGNFSSRLKSSSRTANIDIEWLDQQNNYVILSFSKALWNFWVVLATLSDSISGVRHSRARQKSHPLDRCLKSDTDALQTNPWSESIDFYRRLMESGKRSSANMDCSSRKIVGLTQTWRTFWTWNYGISPDLNAKFDSLPHWYYRNKIT